MAAEYAIEMRGITKTFGSVVANKDVNLTLRKGEILALLGENGSGKTTLMNMLSGIYQPDSGEILLEGAPVTVKNPNQAKESGIALVPEDRKREGVVLGMSLRENICMASHDQLSRLGHIQKRKKDALAQKYIRDLQIRPADADRQIKNFSGGNQQKGVIAKWLATSPKVMILDEPTRGIDVGAKVEIYNIINQLAADGTAVIVVS